MSIWFKFVKKYGLILTLLRNYGIKYLNNKKSKQTHSIANKSSTELVHHNKNRNAEIITE